MNIIKKIVKVILAIMIFCIILAFGFEGFSGFINAMSYKSELFGGIEIIIAGIFTVLLFKLLKD